MSFGHLLASHLLTLPSLLILLALIALIAHVIKPWIGTLLFALSVALWIALSLPLTAHETLQALEIYPPLGKGPPPAHPPQAIVVLGGGRYSEAPEYGGADTVSRMALERLRYAAYLHRQTGLPILVTGGSLYGEDVSEGELMRIALTRDFNVPVAWTETRALDTRQNALFSRELLRTSGIKTVYLVTHAWHMRRAMQAFTLVGLDAVPAPVGFVTGSAEETGVFGYLPSANALRNNNLALHERIGYWWSAWQGAPTP